MSAAIIHCCYSPLPLTKLPSDVPQGTTPVKWRKEVALQILGASAEEETTQPVLNSIDEGTFHEEEAVAHHDASLQIFGVNMISIHGDLQWVPGGQMFRFCCPAPIAATPRAAMTHPVVRRVHDGS